MSQSRTRTWIVAILLSAAFAGGSASAHGVGDHAEVEIVADDSAAAVCQVLVLVNALIILDAEDSLGLVALPASEPAEVVVPLQNAVANATADCSVVIEELDVTFLGDSPMLSVRNHFAGPAVVLQDVGSRPGLEWRVDVPGPGSEGVVCQVVVVLGSIIIGGAAFGLEQTDLPLLDFNAASDGAGGGGDASCRAAIPDLFVNGVQLGPLEAVA